MGGEGALLPAVLGIVEPNAEAPALNVEALGLKEKASAVECGPDLLTVWRLSWVLWVLVVCGCTGAATQPHACAWEAWVKRGGNRPALAYE
jgi:hypothetical protein